MCIARALVKLASELGADDDGTKVNTSNTPMTASMKRGREQGRGEDARAIPTGVVELRKSMRCFIVLYFGTQQFKFLFIAVY